ncbi:MAG: sigma 54-interacting transcriptional regulator [Myxococcales bacterium]|nr:sigma 54-interacting transcriptional regulator [Myxococcales bacterium]
MPTREKDADRTQQTGRLSADELRQVQEAAARARPQAESYSFVIFHRDGIEVLPLLPGRRVIIGRDMPADVILRDPSLSRQHAALSIEEGAVWLEDLNSTNGTWLSGKRIQKERLEAGAEVLLGAVPAALHSARIFDPARAGFINHDRFVAQLEAEIARAKGFSRPLSLLMVKSCAGGECCVSHWFPLVRSLLQPFDQLALYGPETLEILLPECDAGQALDVARRILAGSQSLCCAIGAFPAQARSAEELLSVTQGALRQAGPARPVVTERDPARPAEPGQTELRSQAMRALYLEARRLAASPLPVLIQGETGTGKEILARFIHGEGPRREKPLVCVNCGSIPAQLVESTLFGHVKGAFTGAAGSAAGVFESANGGSVLLDEIGELPLPAQTALLRVLENRRFSRVGSTQEIEVDVRVLAATHRDLEAMCREGRFREDLLYRLNVVPLRVPPLREHPEDIEPLALHFLAEAGRGAARIVRAIHPEALALLARWHWPGNVRELRNAIERAVLIAEQDTIQPSDLPERIRGTQSLPPPAAAAPPAPTGPLRLREELDRREAQLLLEALRRCNFNRERAAAELGLPLRTLAHKMKQHGIRRVRYEKDPEDG